MALTLNSVMEQLQATSAQLAAMAQIMTASAAAQNLTQPVSPAPVVTPVGLAQPVVPEPVNRAPRYAHDAQVTAAVKRLNIPCTNATFAVHAKYGSGLAYYAKATDFPTDVTKPFVRALYLWRTAFQNPGLVIRRDGHGISLFIPGVTPAHLGL